MFSKRTTEHILALKSKNEDRKNVFLEIELRINNFNQHGIKISIYDKLNKYFDLKGYKRTHTETTEYLFSEPKSDKYLRSSIRKVVDESSDVKWHKKMLLLREEYKEYATTLNASLEIHPTGNFDENMIKDRDSPIVRIKIRDSFNLGDIKIDLTKVIMTRNGVDETMYELEAEIIYTKGNRIDTLLDNLSKEGIKLIKLVQDTEVLYSLSELLEVKGWYKRVIRGTKYTNAKVLDYNDLSYGEIVGGNYVMTVGHKPCGQRGRLSFAPNGIWIIMEDGGFRRMTSSSGGYTGAIFDGIEVPENMLLKDLKTKTLFLIFDCLVYGGKTDIQGRNHYGRMNTSKGITDNLKLVPTITIWSMTFHQIASVDEFYNVMDLLFKQDNISYQTEGLIFIPNGLSYGELNRKLLKWKRVPSIDMSVGWKNVGGKGQLKLMVKGEAGNKLVEFKGTEKDPLEVDDSLIRGLESGRVVEMVKEEDKMVLLKYRGDKKWPDSQKTAENVWESIVRPIKIGTLLGKDMRIMKNYHQRLIKDFNIKLVLSPDVLEIKSDFMNIVEDIEKNSVIGTDIGFFMLDKGMVEEIFRPKYRGVSLRNYWIGDIEISYNDGFLKFGDLSSYPFNLIDMIKKLNKNSSSKYYKIEEVKQADDEKFMSDDEKLISKMFIYGKLKVDQKNKEE